jgi:hypothetical protein
MNRHLTPPVIIAALSASVPRGGTPKCGGPTSIDRRVCAAAHGSGTILPAIVAISKSECARVMAERRNLEGR